MYFKSILFILISVFALKAGVTAEIDTVTPRKLKLENSLDSINSIINQRLQEGIQNANEQQDYHELPEEFHKFFED